MFKTQLCLPMFIKISIRKGKLLALLSPYLISHAYIRFHLLQENLRENVPIHKSLGGQV